jgi:hypothetical protein
LYTKKKEGCDNSQHELRLQGKNTQAI